MAEEIATLAGGCFWCTEAVYQNLEGVKAVESGYIGGGLPNPTYEQVCSGTTGHAEAIRITYDPAVIGYGDLLDIFFATHDPTTLNRQGNDIGTQYRSAIFPHSPEQAAAATAGIKRAQADQANPVVTAIEADAVITGKVTRCADASLGVIKPTPDDRSLWPPARLGGLELPQNALDGLVL